MKNLTVRKKMLMLVCICYAASYYYSAPTLAGDFGDKEATVIKNHDGDTMTVSIPDWPSVIGDKISVRVYGIDTPEILGKCADEKAKALLAKAFTEKFVNAKQITLKNIQRDKYFRILANVYVGENSLSEALIKAGLARPYFGDTKSSWCMN
jgi:endonuclease YncB( thermonuclease family)